MTEFERRKLLALRAKYPGFISAEEALTVAINVEEIKRDCGPFDPAFEYFSREQQAMETFALLLEKESAAKTPK